VLMYRRDGWLIDADGVGWFAECCCNVVKQIAQFGLFERKFLFKVKINFN